MKSRLAILLFILVVPLSPLRGADALDLKVPAVTLEGTLRDVASSLGKLGFRVCVEEVNLSSEPTIVEIHMESRERTLRQVFDELSQIHPEVGWEMNHFQMCPVFHIFRKSSVHDPRNPLNVVLPEYSFRDADLVDVSELIYFSSAQFRNLVNPKAAPWARFGSRIGGVSMKPSDLRYSFHLRRGTLRELLDGVCCVSVNNGMSWYFWYDPGKEFPINFILQKF